MSRCRCTDGGCCEHRVDEGLTACCRCGGERKYDVAEERDSYLWVEYKKRGIRGKRDRRIELTMEHA